MKINVVAVGNLKDRFFVDAVAEYLKRLSRYAKVEIKEMPESDPVKEGREILKHLKGHVVALCIDGALMSSEEFADVIERRMLTTSEFTFVIGGSTGLSAEVISRADTKLSFGRMTYPHRLMRVILLEQIYRAMTIINHTSYHK